MSEYHKIQSIYKRDMTSKRKTLLEGQWTLPEFEYLANNIWVLTEKVDGTNIRVIIKDSSITFSGRTDNAQIPAKLTARLNERFLLQAEKLMEIFSGNSAILYGEGYGAKIQKGGENYRLDQDFILFDVKIGELWLQRAAIEDIAVKLGLDVVPIIKEGTLYDAVAYTKAGFRSTWGNFQAEGIVARPKIELRGRNGDRLITKIKCRDFINT